MNVPPNPPTRRSMRTRKRPRLEGNGEATAKSTVSSGQTKKTIPPKRGRLRAMAELPMDVLLEIFKYMLPQDIIWISRVNKALNGVLMSRQSRFVWRCAQKNAEEQVAFPPIPKGWNEIRWFNLFFTPWCQFCGTNPSRKIMWGLQIRICRKCSKQKLAEKCIPKAPFWQETHPDRLYNVFELIRTEQIKRSKKKYLRSELKQVKEEYKNSPNPNAYAQVRLQELAQVNRQAFTGRRWLEQRLEIKERKLTSLIEQRRKAVRAKLVALGYEYEIYAIKAPDSLDKHPLVARPRRLTPKLWNNIKEEIIDYMKQMRAKRLEREKNDTMEKRKALVVDVLRIYKNTQVHAAEPGPSIIDFYKLEPIRSILEQPVTTTVEIAHLAAKEVLAQFPRAFEVWRQQKSMFLASNLSRIEYTGRKHGLDFVQAGHPYHLLNPRVYYGGHFASGVQEDIMNKLPLATTVFSCLRCLKQTQNEYNWEERHVKEDLTPLFYPGILYHHCFNRMYRLSRTGIIQGPAKRERPSTRLKRLDSYRIEWESRPLIRYNHQASDIAYSLVSAAELDPETATVEDMDALDLWLACPCCCSEWPQSGESDSPLIKTVAYQWRSAIAHCLTESKNMPLQWARLTRADLERGKSAYAEAGSELDIIPSPVKDRHWQCMHCRETAFEEGPFELNDAIEHVKARHRVFDPKENTDYCRPAVWGPRGPYEYNIIVEAELLVDDVAHEPRQRNPYICTDLEGTSGYDCGIEEDMDNLDMETD